jgi:Ala-tRNA(Pro) deacylase
MPILTRLQSYLDTNNIPYETVSHPKAYTAHDVAQTLDVSGDLVAKVVVVQADRYFVMTVLPSTWRVDLKRLRDALDARDVRLATEAGICSPIAKWERCRRSGICTAWKCMWISS